VGRSNVVVSPSAMQDLSLALATQSNIDSNSNSNNNKSSNNRNSNNSIGSGGSNVLSNVLPNTRGVAEALSEVGPLFSQTLTDIFVAGGGIGALFNGAVERMLFFGPAGLIFFASYDAIYTIISQLHNNLRSTGTL
jgi:hypothetical protein